MISLQRVTKTYKNGVTALTDVTVEVDKGEFVFIVGQSGSGKSTMIRLLLKEEEATKGDIYVGGKNLGKMSSWDVPKLRRNVGTVFQDYKLLTDKTVFDNVAFGLEVIGKQKHVIDQRVPEILEYVGLGDKLNNYPDELSGGEQQRVSIARACVNRPARAAGRRADRQPRPQHQRRHHAPARQGEPHRHHGRDGHPRSSDRRRDAQARDRARQGQRGARPVAGRLQLMRLEYYFRETAAGLRRNGIVAFAAMSTAFIALFLFGLALLIARQFDLVIEAWTGNVQVAVYLDDPARDDTVTAHPDEARGAARGRVDRVLGQGARPAQQFDTLFEDQEVFQEGVDCEKAIPTSLRINLADPSQFDQITAALGCEADGATQEIQCTEPGVRDVSDYRDLLDRLTAITRVLSIGVLSIAVIMLASAIALVANTLRMGMFARRKEIGIMRLVGATNWRIRVPFLIEGLVEALIGASPRSRPCS